MKIIYKKNDIKKFISNLINQNKSLNIKIEREVEKIFQNIQKIQREYYRFPQIRHFQQFEVFTQNIKKIQREYYKLSNPRPPSSF